MNDDAVLLRRYFEEDSESAFTALVGRHIDLVYGAAMRRTNGDAHLAADVAQQVFITLARDAQKLSRHTVLAAWLHTATRNAALNLMISEQRRKTRESEAMKLEVAGDEGTADWNQLRPLLDTAIDELPEADRAAVVLRFLDRKPFATIGAALQISEDAARMRTDRALDKLRTVLARRGITSTALALGGLVSTQSMIAAPTGLASVLATQSLAAVSMGFFATLMTTKIITTMALTALMAFGSGTYVGLKQETTEPMPVSTTDDQSELVASLQQDNQRLTDDVAGLKADLVSLSEASAKAAAKPVVATPAARLGKSPSIGGKHYLLQQGIMNNLRQINSARVQYHKAKGHAASSIEDLVGTESHHYIKTVRTVGGEEYYGLSMLPGQPLTVVTPDGVSVTFDPAGTMTTKIEIPAEVQRIQELAKKLQPAAMKAFLAYQTAHDGEAPKNEKEILPYFETIEEGADYAEFIEAKQAAGM